jgi:CRP-like cAMP-binding protein
MVDRNTSTVPLRRMLALRQFSPLAKIELGELATLADNVNETVLVAGHEIVARGARVPALHLVIDGCIEAEGRVWGPRDVFGLLEVLASRPAIATARIPVETRTFEIAAEDALEVLEDNFGLLHALLRELAHQLVAIDFRPAPLVPAARPADRMTLVERLIALRRQVPFAKGRLQALAALARTLEPRRWAAGDLVVHANAPADTVIMVLEGELATSGEVPRIVGPGGALGALETLAGLRHVEAVRATAPTSALCCSASAIVDVLEDHTDLALAITAALAGLLLDAHVPQAN